MWKQEPSLKTLTRGKKKKERRENGTSLGSRLSMEIDCFLFTFNTSLDEILDPRLAILSICRIWESFYMLLAILQVTGIQFTHKRYILLTGLAIIIYNHWILNLRTS